MFASNGKLSIRQIERLMLFNIFGISSLVLPQMLAAGSEIDGGIAILAGMLLSFAFLGLLGKIMGQMQTNYYAYLKNAFGTLISDFCFIFYFFYSVCLSGFAAYNICQLIAKNLLKEESFFLLLLLLLVVGGYGLYGGLECGGRVYEMLFGFFTILLFLMLALSVSSVELDKISPVFYVGWIDLLKSSYLVFGFFSLVFFSLFLKPYCTKKEDLTRTMGKVVLIIGILLFFVYLILVGIFGGKSLSKTPYSIVILMSMVKIPGGFLKRLDAIMVGIWFFAIYALMDNTIFYSVDIFMNTFALKQKKYPALLVLFLVYGIAGSCQNSIFFLNLLKQLFYMIGTPLVVLIPLLAYLTTKGKERKKYENVQN